MPVVFTSSLWEAALRLQTAAADRRPCPPIRECIEPTDIDAAYTIQRLNVEQRLAEGQRLVGSKIGLTSTVVQRQLGVDQPDFGRLFADMAICDGEEIDTSRLLQPKVEAEIALVLAHDMPAAQATIVDLITATAYLLPAIEVVDSRIADWDISLADTIADNASCGLFVLGNRPVALADVDVIGCGMVMEKRGEPVSVGTGSACMGNPLYAALWLANTLAARGEPLKAGGVILTGALGPMVAVQPGDVFTARIDGLGSVTACFSAEKEAK